MRLRHARAELQGLMRDYDRGDRGRHVWRLTPGISFPSDLIFPSCPITFLFCVARVLRFRVTCCTSVKKSRSFVWDVRKLG